MRNVSQKPPYFNGETVSRPCPGAGTHGTHRDEDGVQKTLSRVPVYTGQGMEPFRLKLASVSRSRDTPPLSGEQDGAVEATSSWAEVDIGAVLDNDNRRPPPAQLARTDGKCLIYNAK